MQNVIVWLPVGTVCSHVTKYFTISKFVSFAVYLFCLGVDGLSHPSPALPTESNFDSLFKEFTSFIFGSEENGGLVTPAQLQSLSGYQANPCFELLICFIRLKQLIICNFCKRAMFILLMVYGFSLGM